jgi:hypothetical protein
MFDFNPDTHDPVPWAKMTRLAPIDFTGTPDSVAVQIYSMMEIIRGAIHCHCPSPNTAPQAERRYVTWKVALDAGSVWALKAVADFRRLSLKRRSGQMSTVEF